MRPSEVRLKSECKSISFIQGFVVEAVEHRFSSCRSYNPASYQSTFSVSVLQLPPTTSRWYRSDDPLVYFGW